MRPVLIVGLLVGFGLVPEPVLYAPSNEQAMAVAKQEAQAWIALYGAGDYDSTWVGAS